MVRKLFILRHGEAASGSKWTDHERPLTSLGKETIALQGKKLAERKVPIDLMISSDATRTRQTTKTLLLNHKAPCKVIYLPELYNVSINQMLQVLTRLDKSYKQVVLVGHNPALSELSAYVLGLHFISMDPGQLIACELELDDWAELSANSASMIEI